MKRLTSVSARLVKRKWWLFVTVLALVFVPLSLSLLGGKVHTISKGVLYQSGALDDGELLAAIDALGIRSVIDLRMVDEEPGAAELIDHEREALGQAGIQHVHIPSFQVPGPEVVERFLEVMRDAGRLPALVHCKHGYGRSVLLSALYRIEFEGWDRDRARRATRSPLRLPWSSFSEESAKGAFLLDYVPRVAALR